MERERLGSRLGFILLSEGCAIGCGNVWKFPWVAGESGGGAFVLPGENTNALAERLTELSAGSIQPTRLSLQCLRHSLCVGHGACGDQILLHIAPPLYAPHPMPGRGRR